MGEGGAVEPDPYRDTVGLVEGFPDGRGIHTPEGEGDNPYLPLRILLTLYPQSGYTGKTPPKAEIILYFVPPHLFDAPFSDPT
jgi:hypothetical protein